MLRVMERKVRSSPLPQRMFHAKTLTTLATVPASKWRDHNTVAQAQHHASSSRCPAKSAIPERVIRSQESVIRHDQHQQRARRNIGVLNSAELEVRLVYNGKSSKQ
jgi:hypothetical protein